MAHIYKMEEWQSPSGKWHCGDVSALGKNSNLWWYVPNLLGITPVDYFYLLRDKFHATNFHYKKQHDVFMFSFENLTDCRKFKNYVNKIAREKKFITY